MIKLECGGLSVAGCALPRLRKGKRKARRYKKPIEVARLMVRERRSMPANAGGGGRGVWGRWVRAEGEGEEFTVARV